MQSDKAGGRVLMGQQECCAQHFSRGSMQLAPRDRVSWEPLGVLVFHSLRTEMTMRSFALISYKSQDRYPKT